jgi:hypothetical protein
MINVLDVDQLACESKKKGGYTVSVNYLGRIRLPSSDQLMVPSR